MAENRVDNQRIDAQLSDLSPSKTLAASGEHADKASTNSK